MEFTDNSFSLSFHSPFVSDDHIQRIQTDDLCTKHNAKLEEVRRVVQEVGKNSIDGLIMVDTLQRLGIDYHFREEIEEILKCQYVISSATTSHDNPLYELALRHRLLRQQGFHMSPDELVRSLKNMEGTFDLSIGNDHMKGLMALYEASQLSMEGEDKLDEAGEYCATLLTSRLPHLHPHQSKIVANTLMNPYHKSLTSLMINSFINIDDLMEVPSHDQYTITTDFLELMEMDRRINQLVYQKEILQITKWWKDLGLAKELKFARNQPLKWHMWSMFVLTDPNLSEQRLDLTKPISLVYIIDDIFDVFGTLHELTLFTEAVNKWDIAAANQLPECMKLCLKALYDITDNISQKIFEKHGWDPTASLQKSWANLCKAFLVEAKWFESGKMPKAEEYLKNGIVSSGVNVVLVHLFFLLGHGFSKDTVDFVDNFPHIISSTATILRLYDDLGTAKDEEQDGNDGSYLACYMKENPEVTSEGARKEVMRLISSAWKRLNHTCFSSPNPFSPTFTDACLNVARMVPLMYSHHQYPNHSPLLYLQELIKIVAI